MSKEESTMPASLTNTLKHINELVEQSVQIYELDKEKSNVVDEFFNSFKIISNYLGFAVDIDPILLNQSPDTRVVLTPMLDLIIISSNYKCEQKRLDEFSLEEIANISLYAIQTLLTMTKTDIAYKNKKITFLRDVTKKLKQLRSFDDQPDVTKSQYL